jgi:hypothetical protein
VFLPFQDHVWIVPQVCLVRQCKAKQDPYEFDATTTIRQYQLQTFRPATLSAQEHRLVFCDRHPEHIMNPRLRPFQAACIPLHLFDTCCQILVLRLANETRSCEVDVLGIDGLEIICERFDR